MAASNVLEGFACPNCGQDESFQIPVIIRGVADVTDDGFDIGDISFIDSEWDTESGATARCDGCGHQAPVADFQNGG